MFANNPIYSYTIQKVEGLDVLCIIDESNGQAGDIRVVGWRYLDIKGRK